MKKIKYLLFTILLFLICYEAKALVNNGKLYEIYWGDSGVNVFAKDMTYNSMDYNGWFVVSNTDGYTYYCIEPETYMQNTSDAVNNTHEIYEGDSNIIDNSRLNIATLEKVKLLAYYGYGYKDNNVNHEGRHWYGITQVMIWRVLRPDINYVFKESRYGNVNGNLWLNEVNELQALVDNHYKSPSFHNQSFVLKKGETIVLEDTNNVLSNFNVTNKKYADFSITGNKLTITAKEEIYSNIVFGKQEVNNDFKLFKSSNLQDIITRGKVTTSQFGLTLIIQGKEIIIKKIDKDTGSFNEKLVGSVFGLYDKDNNLIKEIQINNEEEVITLMYGNYYLKEIKASEEYNINDKVYKFEVTASKNNIELIIENEKIKGDLEFTKVDYSSNKPLEGVLIEIYKEDNTLVYSGRTNKKGKIILNDLEYGEYYILEKETIKYYELSNERINFEIKENNVVIKKTMVNHRKEGGLEFLKIDQNTKEPLKDTEIELYFEETNELIFKGSTNEEGKISLTNLVAGKYVIIEKQPSYGYLLNKDKIYFEIEETNEIVKIIMTNEKIEVPNTGSFDKSVMLYLIFICLTIGINILKEEYEKSN